MEIEKENRKAYLSRDGGSVVGLSGLVDDVVIGQNDDVALDFLRHALRTRARNV